VSFHPEVLSPDQRALLRRLGPLGTRLGFYLGGGTAVAIRVGHRRSIDFDWFTEDRIPDPRGLAERMAGELPELRIESLDRGTLHARVGGVRVSFFEYPYPAIRPPADWAEYGCRIASAEDLACMKLAAIAARGSKRDFFDLYALGRSGLDLAGMLESYQRKFQVEDTGHVLMSLTYFDDAEKEEAPALLQGMEWEQVKRALEAWVAEYVRARAPGPGPGAGGGGREAGRGQG